MKVRVTMVFEFDSDEDNISALRTDIQDDPLDVVLEYTDWPIEVTVEGA